MANNRVYRNYNLNFYVRGKLTRIVKVSDRSLNGSMGVPVIGEPTKIYGYTPTEKEMKQVTRIAITRKPF